MACRAVLTYILAFLLLSWGGYDREWITTVAGMVLLVVAARLLRNDLVDAPKRIRRGVPAAMIIAGLGLAAYWWFGTPTGGWGLAGLCALFLGVGHAVTLWRKGERWRRTRGIVVLIVSAGLFVLGIGLCLAWHAFALGLSLGGLLLAPVGITLLSEDLLEERAVGRRWPLIGGGLVLVGAAVLLSFGARLDLTLVVVAGVGVLVWAIASDTLADVLLIAALIALFWVTYPEDVANDDAVEVVGTQPTLVALGDSYMSGEGAPAFYDRTSDPAQNNQCRRAPTAYARLTVEQRPAELQRLAFFACSGARGKHIHRVVQQRGEPVDITPERGQFQLQQLSGLLANADVRIRYVIVSIGGNDAGFSDIGMACVAPGSCVERGQQWLDKLTEGDANVEGEVRAAFEAIRGAVGQQVPVLVVPYPVPIREQSCGYSLLSDDEHKFVNAFVGELNGVIRTVAGEQDVGFYVLEPMATAFEDQGLRICDTEDLDDSGMNFIALRSARGVLDQATKPNTWIHNSFHPNPTGHAAMAEVLATWLDAHPDPPALPGPADAPSPYTARSLEDIMGADVTYCGGEDPPAHCGRDHQQWAITQLAWFLAKVALPLLALVGGAWLLAMSALARRRARP